MTRRLAWAVATGMGCGLFPWFPGTVGSLAALIVYWLLLPDSAGNVASLAIYSLVVAAALAAGCWAAGRREKERGRDHRTIVIDEFVGQWITLIALPKTPIVAAAGFFIFRFFDILKPFPVRRMESLPGGLGVMADDLAAGVYSNIVLWVLIWVGLPLVVR